MVMPHLHPNAFLNSSKLSKIVKLVYVFLCIVAHISGKRKPSRGHLTKVGSHPEGDILRWDPGSDFAGLNWD